MRSIEGPQTPFEVYCPSCKVTFPIGTRRCLHCGGRVIAPDRRQTAASMIPIRPAETAGRRPPLPSGSAGREESRRRPTLEELAEAAVPGTAPGRRFPDDEVDEMLPTRRFSLTTTLWIVLALTGAAIRMCGGGG